MNTVLMHPTLPHIVTSGIERHVILHSPTPSSQCASDLVLTSQRTRRLISFDSPDEEREDQRLLDIAIFEDDAEMRRNRGQDHDDDVDVEGGERSTISLFDRQVIASILIPDGA